MKKFIGIFYKYFNKSIILQKTTKKTTVTGLTAAISTALVFFYLNNEERKQKITIYSQILNDLIQNHKNKFILHAKNKQKQEPEASKVDKDDEIPEQENFTSNNSRKKIFFQYASVEYNGIPYMTPMDFIDSVTFDRSRPRTRRKVLKQVDVEKYLKATPPLKKSSTKFFRNLENKGLITYSEYLFLLCVITKPKSRFEIAFNMFDIDGNKSVDKREFLVVTKIFQRDTERKVLKGQDEGSKLIDSLQIIDVTEYVDTTLLVHLFGHKGKDVLYFTDFTKFMENLQMEILEVEFNEFAKGLNKISELEFAEILLRYTEFEEEIKREKLNKLESEIEEYSRGISFENFRQFSIFMNNLDDFSLALKYHNYANKSISKNEFQRAVKISSGFELDDQIVDVIFRVFDEDNDQHLSYKEFIAVMKDRIRRTPKSNQSSKRKEFEQTFAQEFKACMRSKLHDDQYS